MTLVFSHAQTGTAHSESIAALSDSIIKREIASFTITGAAFHKADSLPKVILNEIPLRHCSNKEVHLSGSTLKSSESTFIHLYFKGESPNKTLDSIFLVTHSHYWVKFPAAAYQGLYQSNSCHFTAGGKKATFSSPYYKAFYSADKMRLYIYMIGGNDAGKYEVTWVIVDDKYYTRVLDNIP